MNSYVFQDGNAALGEDAVRFIGNGHFGVDMFGEIWWLFRKIKNRPPDYSMNNNEKNFPNDGPGLLIFFLKNERNDINIFRLSSNGSRILNVQSGFYAQVDVSFEDSTVSPAEETISHFDNGIWRRIKCAIVVSSKNEEKIGFWTR